MVGRPAQDRMAFAVTPWRLVVARNGKAMLASDPLSRYAAEHATELFAGAAYPNCTRGSRCVAWREGGLNSTRGPATGDSSRGHVGRSASGVHRPRQRRETPGSLVGSLGRAIPCRPILYAPSLSNRTNMSSAHGPSMPSSSMERKAPAGGSSSRTNVASSPDGKDCWEAGRFSNRLGRSGWRRSGTRALGASRCPAAWGSVGLSPD